MKYNLRFYLLVIHLQVMVKLCCRLMAAQPQHYPWPEKTMQQIEDYEQWLKAEWDRLMKFKYYGPSAEAWPKKPRLYFRKETAQSTKLQGQELHDYLVSNCVNPGVVICPVTMPCVVLTLAQMKPHLIAGWEKTQQHRRETLAWYIDYGEMLNRAFVQHELEDTTTDTWDEWLEQNVGISSPQSRKIRVVAKLLKPYPSFKKLALSFSEVYNHRKQIETMLEAVNQPWHNYWKG